jgi:hypothetical protein
MADERKPPVFAQDGLTTAHLQNKMMQAEFQKSLTVAHLQTTMAAAKPAPVASAPIMQAPPTPPAKPTD